MSSEDALKIRETLLSVGLPLYRDLPPRIDMDIAIADFRENLRLEIIRVAPFTAFIVIQLSSA